MRERRLFPFSLCFRLPPLIECGGCGCAGRSATPPTVKYRTASHAKLAVHSGNLVTDAIKLLIRLSISCLSGQRASPCGFYQWQDDRNVKEADLHQLYTPYVQFQRWYATIRLVKNRKAMNAIRRLWQDGQMKIGKPNWKC